MRFDLFGLRKCLLQERNHDGLQLRTDTTTIKTDTRDLRRIQLREKLTTQNLCNNGPILMEGIDALGGEK